MTSKKLIVAPRSLTCSMTAEEVESTSAFGELTEQVLEWHNAVMKRLLTDIEESVNDVLKEHNYEREHNTSTD